VYNKDYCGTKIPQLALFLVSLLMPSSIVHGQIPRPLPVQTEGATTPKPLGGTWKGQIEITAPNGQKEHSTGLLWLKARGSHMLGAIGASEDSLSAIKNARATLAGCQFALLLHNATQVAFDLHLSEGHLQGEGIGPEIKIEVDLQPAPGVHPLYEQIATLDAKLFDAFNARDLTTLKAMFSKNLEFYHDKNGEADYDQNMDSFKRHFASPTKIRRELDDETLEVYPVKGFGAMEIGVHRFYSTERGQQEKLTATAKFVHVWKNSKGAWQIVRVVSYDHE